MLIKHREILPLCPQYSKKLSACPSSKEIIGTEDLNNLLDHCSKNFESCKIFKKANEKAA